ncbi:Putative F-box and FNIP repeat-containing protein L60 [Durusdinium trenchii]|uniref:F-box and FNIP repeat-containing protein L60 n=1 Tax=Durusdinium trenchii TaxID=1381693 RepID=A0ABP0MDH6_9DINO
MKGSQKLSLSKTLAQEGLLQEDQEEPTSLSYAYEVANLQEAWRCIQNALSTLMSRWLSRGYCSYEGCKRQLLSGTLSPSSTLPLAMGSTISLQGVSWPSGLQSLSFGREFNRSLEGVTWPSGLQSLSFGGVFNQSLEGVALPNSLESLSFGFAFNQCLEGVAWPSGLQSIQFKRGFGALKRVNWPSSLQCLVVWGPRSEVVEMDLPWGLQRFECRLDEEEEEGMHQTRQWMISTSEDRKEE